MSEFRLLPHSSRNNRIESCCLMFVTSKNVIINQNDNVVPLVCIQYRRKKRRSLPPASRPAPVRPGSPDGSAPSVGVARCRSSGRYERGRRAGQPRRGESSLARLSAARAEEAVGWGGGVERGGRSRADSDGRRRLRGFVRGALERSRGGASRVSTPVFRRPQKAMEGGDLRR